MVSAKAVRQALYQKLNVSQVTTLLGGGSASLVHSVGGPKAVYPLCVFHRSSSVTTHTLKETAYDSELWVVQGVTRDINASATPPSAAVAESIDAEVRALLDHATLTITGGTALYVARESGAPTYSVPDGDQLFHHVGGLYRLVIA